MLSKASRLLLRRGRRRRITSTGAIAVRGGANNNYISTWTTTALTVATTTTTTMSQQQQEATGTTTTDVTRSTSTSTITPPHDDGSSSVVLTDDRLLILPPQLSAMGVPGQGWQIATTVRQSQIPGAGNGRFADEPVAKANARVSIKPIVPAASIIGGRSGSGDSCLRAVPHDATIAFSSREELEGYICAAEAEGGYPRSQVLKVFEHFLWSLDGERVFLNNCTWSTNHADEETGGMNIAFKEMTVTTVPPEGGGDGNNKAEAARSAIVGVALAPIAVGEELRNNYRDFRIPSFYREFCQAHGFKDVRTSVLETVDAAAAAR